jgi:hypothetical protein
LRLGRVRVHVNICTTVQDDELPMVERQRKLQLTTDFELTIHELIMSYGWFECASRLIKHRQPGVALLTMPSRSSEMAEGAGLT